MSQRLRVPDEPRFVRAFALAVDPGDTLGLLMEIGALGSHDPSASLWTGIGIVRHTREALIPAYDRCPGRLFSSGRFLGNDPNGLLILNGLPSNGCIIRPGQIAGTEESIRPAHP